jgi:hypothetical protein
VEITLVKASDSPLVEILQQQRQLPSPDQPLALGGFLIDPAQFDILDEE